MKLKEIYNRFSEYQPSSDIAYYFYTTDLQLADWTTGCLIINSEYPVHSSAFINDLTNFDVKRVVLIPSDRMKKFNTADDFEKYVTGKYGYENYKSLVNIFFPMNIHVDDWTAKQINFHCWLMARGVYDNSI